MLRGISFHPVLCGHWYAFEMCLAFPGSSGEINKYIQVSASDTHFGSKKRVVYALTWAIRLLPQTSRTPLWASSLPTTNAGNYSSVVGLSKSSLCQRPPSAGSTPPFPTSGSPRAAWAGGSPLPPPRPFCCGSRSAPVAPAARPPSRRTSCWSRPARRRASSRRPCPSPRGARAAGRSSGTAARPSSGPAARAASGLLAARRAAAMLTPPPINPHHSWVRPVRVPPGKLPRSLVPANCQVRFPCRFTGLTAADNCNQSSLPNLVPYVFEQLSV